MSACDATARASNWSSCGSRLPAAPIARASPPRWNRCPRRRYRDGPGGKDVAAMHTAIRQLELVSETKIFDILPGSLDQRLEASGVLAKDEMFYVIFDNLPHIACISPELSPAAGGHRMIVQERGLRSGFEDIAHDPQAGRFYVLIESLPRGRGVFMAAVQEY